MLDLDTRIKLFNEYLENGGIEKLFFPELLESLMKVKSDNTGKVIPETVDSQVRAAMNVYVGTQLLEPFTAPDHLSEYESFLQKNIFFNQTRIDSKEELEKFILDVGNKENHIYHGAREARWRLYSSLQRHWVINKYHSKGILHKEFIIDLIKRGRKISGNTNS